jgi:dienelactone hydrolase
MQLSICQIYEYLITIPPAFALSQTTHNAVTHPMSTLRLTRYSSFDSEVLPPKNLEDESRLKELDMPSFFGRNSKANRQATVFEYAKALRSQYKRIGAIGFCFSGWAVFQIGAKSNNLIDCISTGHPRWLEKSEIENVGVPVQILAPEFDAMFTPELKEFSNKVIPTLGGPYDYQYFPSVKHSFATRGDQ